MNQDRAETLSGDLNVVPELVTLLHDCGVFVETLHRALIEFSFRNTSFLAQVPAPLLDAIAAFPESMPCRR